MRKQINIRHHMGWLFTLQVYGIFRWNHEVVIIIHDFHALRLWLITCTHIHKEVGYVLWKGFWGETPLIKSSSVPARSHTCKPHAKAEVRTMYTEQMHKTSGKTAHMASYVFSCPDRPLSFRHFHFHFHSRYLTLSHSSVCLIIGFNNCVYKFQQNW